MGPRRLLVGLSLVSGCGRVAFDATTTDTGDGGDGATPLPARDIDLTDCTQRPYSFSRASPAQYLDASGLWATVANDEPRCTAKGVLLEQERVNRFFNSSGSGVDTDGLPNGWHSQHDAQVTAVGTSAPGGFGTAFAYSSITVTNTAGSPQYYQVMLDVPITAADLDYTFSWFARAPNATGIQTCATFLTYWDAGFVTLVGSEPTVAVGIPGSEWTRISRVVHPVAGSAEIQPFFACTPKGNDTYTLDLAAPQFEDGARPTTPIATTAGAAGRDVDQLKLSDLPWSSTGKGTFVFDVLFESPGPRPVMKISNAAGAALYSVSQQDGGQWLAADGGSFESVVPGDAMGAHRIALRFGARFAFAVDGELAIGPQHLLDTSGFLAIANLDGYIVRIRYWTVELSDAELTALSL